MNDASLMNVKTYYGSTLETSGDLLTDACCTLEAPPRRIREALSHVHEDVRARYFGCGLIAPDALESAHILDLGSGAGQDCYVLAQLAGPSGRVVGVDATQEQLAVARRHADWHQARFGFPSPTVSFISGDIARLQDLDLEPGSFDVIVSNCVINLVDDKAAVFAAAHRLLKPGGELYFSDVYSDRRVAAQHKADPVLHGECLSGALYWNDFLTLAKAAGFADPRLVTDRPLGINDERIAELLAPCQFFSATFRLFKLEGLEPACEDYGQVVCYRGGIDGAEQVLLLDKHHRFEAGKIERVCGNTWRMLHETRFEPHFTFFGDLTRHFGIFQGCGTDIPFSGAGDSPGGPQACC